MPSVGAGAETETGVQRYYCKDCGRTYCGRTGSEIERIHQPHLFLAVVEDMLGDRDPLSLRKLARKLGVDKSTVWRWRLIIHKALEEQFMPALSGLVEADEAFQRESRKGSREWVRHYNDPLNFPAPPRHRWYEYGSAGLLMERGLSRWQLPILTVVDRGGQRLFERIPDRKDLTIATALRPILSADVVLCSDGLSGYRNFAASANIDHYVVGSKSGTRMASATHHIQNVNSLHSRYSTFIGRFRGPASKYLPGICRRDLSSDLNATAGRLRAIALRANRQLLAV